MTMSCSLSVRDTLPAAAVTAGRTWVGGNGRIESQSEATEVRT